PLLEVKALGVFPGGGDGGVKVPREDLWVDLIEPCRRCGRRCRGSLLAVERFCRCGSGSLLHFLEPMLLNARPVELLKVDVLDAVDGPRKFGASGLELRR